eukprot:c16748_g1_i1.p1 GENE.c16748_g1_i1~~c16748_g1_i1.p1  ORF type:complete len:210 (+),score=35.41 c16748_g1_i1:30-632(+)
MFAALHLNLSTASRRLNLFQLNQAYERFTLRRPFLSAAMTSGTIIGTGDVISQTLLAPKDAQDDFDWLRLLSAAGFGMFYYSGPLRIVYKLYDRVIPTRPVLKTLIDCCVHTPFGVIPCYYYFTGAIRGQSIRESTEKLKRDFFSVGFGSMGFWLPVMFFTFRVVPSHARVLVVSTGSFVHKTWLCWISNRKPQPTLTTY